MAVALRHVDESKRKELAERRVASETGGLSYLAAKDFLSREGEGSKPPAKAKAG